MPIVVRNGNTYSINDAATEDARKQLRMRELRRARLKSGPRRCIGTTTVFCCAIISANKEFCQECVKRTVANRSLNTRINLAHEFKSESD